jgi:hypothetical protein
MALTLPDDVWVHIGLHLKPRHLSKLMRTCKRINRLVDNETYWTRVVAHLSLRDTMVLDIGPPEGQKLPFSVYLPREDPSLYFMVGLDRGYYHGMQRFIQRISDNLAACIEEGDENDREWALKKQNQTFFELTFDVAFERWFPEDDGMKGFAKAATIQCWIEGKKHLKDQWPKIRKFLIDLEDDPMPVVYKRRFFRNMWDAFGDSLQVYCGLNDSPFVREDLCIF